MLHIKINVLIVNLLTVENYFIKIQKCLAITDIIFVTFFNFS